MAWWLGYCYSWLRLCVQFSKQSDALCNWAKHCSSRCSCPFRYKISSSWGVSPMTVPMSHPRDRNLISDIFTSQRLITLVFRILLWIYSCTRQDTGQSEGYSVLPNEWIEVTWNEKFFLKNTTHCRSQELKPWPYNHESNTRITKLSNVRF